MLYARYNIRFWFIDHFYATLWKLIENLLIDYSQDIDDNFSLNQ